MIDYNSVFRDTAREIKPSGIRKFFDIAAEMDDIISLSVGEPDFLTPWHIRKAAIQTLEKGKTRYSANKGMSELCEEITKYYSRRFSLEYDPVTEAMVTVGGSEAIDIAIRTLVNSGDEVIIPEPCFVCYSPIAQLMGGVCVPIETRAEDDFKLTAEQLRAAITPKTKLLILPYPNNPTGAVMRAADLEAVAEVLRGTDIMVLSDEIYAELTYGGEQHVSIASIDGMRERTIVVNGFSKAYSMTGWRLGFVLAPSPVIEIMNKIHQYAIMCSPTTSQYAAIEALRNGDEGVADMRNDYDMRRKFIVNGFREMGFECMLPGGAFYVFPCIKSSGLSSAEFCTRLILFHKVAIVPGDAFGACGEGFVRVSYAYSLSHITEALTRIKRFVDDDLGLSLPQK